MKTKVIFPIFVCLLLLPPALLSQEDQLRRALVFPKAGKGTSGYLTGIRIGDDDDTLVIFSRSQPQKILVGDLSKVIVLSQNRGGNGFLHGALLGTYITTLLLGQGTGYYHQPTAFLTDTYSKGAGLLLTAALGIGFGGGIGSLLKSESGTETSYNFVGSEIERKSARMNFYKLMSEESNSSNLHFSVQGGHVYSQVSKDFENAIGGGYYGNDGEIVEFNWLRKMQLTYSLQPDFELGVAVQWSGEPTVSANGYDNPDPNTSRSRNATQSLSVVGYYGVCKYQPFYGTMPKQIEFVAGGGIGIVDIAYSRAVNTSMYSYNPPYNSTQTYVQDNVNEATASTIMFAEFNVFLRESLSLGLSADYVYYAPKKVPANPVANLPEEIIFGNACIGFVIGVHL
jgi:hypothetical protein